MAAKKTEETKAVEAAEEVVKAEEPKIPWDQQMVRVKLFKDTERYKDDVTVVHNGKAWKIQRGVETDIPMYVWLVIEEGLKQDTQTANLITAESESYKEKEKNFVF